ncbi:hypothetical protein [Nitratifractor sp.]
MYHYLKWAAVGLFLRRNLRVLGIILLAAAMILLSDWIYRDLVDYNLAVGYKDRLWILLLGKWVWIVCWAGVLVWGVFRIVPSGRGKRLSETKRPKGSEQLRRVDTIDRRLEKFRHGKVRRRSEILLEKKGKKGDYHRTK